MEMGTTPAEGNKVDMPALYWNPSVPARGLSWESLELARNNVVRRKSIC